MHITVESIIIVCLLTLTGYEEKSFGRKQVIENHTLMPDLDNWNIFCNFAIVYANINEIMENLTQHIEYLLQIHDCVIVPGIGAFISIYKAPAFDKNTSTISAPRREIRFNPALKTDDGMLANSIARKEQISYREGSEIMTRAIEALGQTILMEGEVTIGKLGVIKREEEGNIRFYPFKTSERISLDLGLADVSVKGKVSSIHTSNAPVTTEEATIDSDVDGKETTPLSEPENEISDPDRINKLNFEKNYYIPVNKIFAKVCACLMAVSIFAMIWIRPSIYNSNLEDRASVVPIDKVIDSAIRKTEPQKPSKKDKKISNHNLFNSNKNTKNIKNN